MNSQPPKRSSKGPEKNRAHSTKKARTVGSNLSKTEKKWTNFNNDKRKRWRKGGYGHRKVLLTWSSRKTDGKTRQMFLSSIGDDIRVCKRVKQSIGEQTQAFRRIHLSQKGRMRSGCCDKFRVSCQEIKRGMSHERRWKEIEKHLRPRGKSHEVRRGNSGKDLSQREKIGLKKVGGGKRERCPIREKKKRGARVFVVMQCCEGYYLEGRGGGRGAALFEESKKGDLGGDLRRL